MAEKPKNTIPNPPNTKLNSCHKRRAIPIKRTPVIAK